MKKEDLLIIIALLHLPSLIQTFPNQNSYIPVVRCNMCPAGTFLKENCNSTAQPDPICPPCTLGIEFQPGENIATTCAKCKTHCPQRMEIVKNCTTISDTICHCKSGFYEIEKDVCMPHTKCKTDEALLKGDHEKDAKCEKCKNGSTFLEAATKTCQSCINCSTELCKPFCMPAHLEKTAGFPVWAIVVIILAVGAVVIVVLAVFARNGRGPNCLQNCLRSMSSNAASAPPEESHFISDGTNGSPRMNGQHCTH